MSTIANAKVAHNYNRYNGYFFGCLRNIGAPFAYSGRRTPQLFGKPFIGSFFIYEYNFYPIFHRYSFEVILLRSACTLFISRYPSV